MAATPAVKTTAKSTNTVTVACKLPHGLLLRIFRMVEGTENVAGNTVRAVKVAEAIGEPVKINGVAVEFGKEKALVSGFAMTHGVDKDFFELWLKQNADMPAVKSGLIFAAGSRDAVEGEAEDKVGVKSGLEPLDMTMVKRGDRMVAKDERLPRPTNRNLSPLAPDTEKASAA